MDSVQNCNSYIRSTGKYQSIGRLKWGASHQPKKWTQSDGGWVLKEVGCRPELLTLRPTPAMCKKGGSREPGKTPGKKIRGRKSR
jgi:hypothetical protein